MERCFECWADLENGEDHRNGCSVHEKRIWMIECPNCRNHFYGKMAEEAIQKFEEHPCPIYRIRTTHNGYIFEDSDGEFWTFEHQHDDNSEVEAFADLLRSVSELIGPTTGRYSEKRIYIRVGPGDKSEKAGYCCKCCGTLMERNWEKDHCKDCEEEWI